MDTSGVAHYVISHDPVNLPIFCYDYKLSTIITFENSYYNKLYTIIINISGFFGALLGWQLWTQVC